MSSSKKNLNKYFFDGRTFDRLRALGPERNGRWDGMFGYGYRPEIYPFKGKDIEIYREAFDKANGERVKNLVLKRLKGERT